MSAPLFGPPREVVKTIYEIAPEVLEELAMWIEQRGLRAPASQVTGLKPAVGVLAGNGSPETVVPAAVGTLYRRLDGGAATTLYVKESGAGTNTGWIAK